jgi:hypothetical protein
VWPSVGGITHRVEGGRTGGTMAGLMRRATNTIRYSGQLPLARGVDLTI